jgi:hypothetical protein
MIRLREDFETRFFISDNKDTYIHNGIDYSFCTDIRKLRQQNYGEKDLGKMS